MVNGLLAIQHQVIIQTKDKLFPAGQHEVILDLVNIQAIEDCLEIIIYIVTTIINRFIPLFDNKKLTRYTLDFSCIPKSNYQ